MPITTGTAADLGGLVEALRLRSIEVDDSSRRLWEYSYDASNYRVSPAAVAFPRTVEEVREVVRACADTGVPVVARGGGTSMAGNAVGEGVVLDLSRWMTTTDEVDAETQTVWVDAGVVLGELRNAVEQVSGGKSTFAPDPSSLSRATIGGSIGNDACGNHSVAYGRMTQHVLEVELVTADGAHLRAGRGTIRAVDPSDVTSVQRAAQLETDLRQLARDNLATIRQELQTIPRQVSGYHLGELLPENGFHLARALAGSEGTCAVLVRARVALVPRPRTTALLCLGYEDTVESARDVMSILATSPTAIEGLDSSIVEIMRHRRGADSVDSLPRGNAYLMVEFSADTIAVAAAECERLLEVLRRDGRVLDHTIVTAPQERAKLWRVREDGAGLSSRRVDGVQTWPGWEDSAVAPERLADYLAALLTLVSEHGYTAFTYGHFGAGCVHMRLDFDLRSQAGRATFEQFTQRAAALVVAHGGSLSGEHGDGRARSQLLDIMYSPEVIDLFGEFKRLWDPQGTLNPGIIVDPVSFSADLALHGLPEADHPRGAGSSGQLGGKIVEVGSELPVRGELSAAAFAGSSHACIGVGRCRATSGGFMCPSYRATKDEKDSTRGRARVLQELTRTQGSNLGGWSTPQVREALDLCLSCKACSSDCPTGVDIAEAKSQLIDEHYRGRLRPFTHYTIGWLPRWLPLLTQIAPLANVGARVPLARRLGERLGISSRRRLPAFVPARVRRRHLREADFNDHAEVLVFADSFTRAFRPEVIPAAARVLEETGASVGCTPEACCGLTWISTGQRDGARRRLRRLVERFDDGTDRPIVVLEPSCAATIRDEAPKLVGGEAAQRVAARVRSFATAVDEALARGWRPSATPPQRAVLQVHCHEHAVFGSEAQRRVLATWGVADVTTSSSCCGVAGNFGFEAEHFDTSMQVAAHSIAPALSSAAEAPVLTDGFSCAMQVSQIDALRGSSHLASMLDPAPSPDAEASPATQRPRPTAEGPDREH
ncbi:FAD-binding and (Fe-S)-binding domain-containing protein [Kineococcus aurantiacus]|uniref:FAD/FMN-containing dehydrogenase/Fe-S oxidoreductase n=1 Tax=Kineococcus aurantiacus TaxID=37633 RepID=A0A7Y9DRH8_9ACTN|nr:FAD-binding and (Fe-S)-binding domain-containing protein [Kineococcus aurantiacus]NYD25156.1 FAD/FMN-containing dehydrogenase/Fe-S oxidoreductase [Kineococcus aurantiacus]